MTEPEPPSTIPAQFAATVAARGACDAVATIDASVTYAELERRSAELARALLAMGAGKGARIALLAPDGIFWITAFLASLRIGALITCCSTLCTPKELAHMLRERPYAAHENLRTGAFSCLRVGGSLCPCGFGKFSNGEIVNSRLMRRAADEFAVVDCDVMPIFVGGILNACDW